MANLLQSSETSTTTTPDWYNNTMTTLASQGANAAGVGTGAAPLPAAQFVDYNALQNQAYTDADSATKGYQDTLTGAGTALSNAASATSPLAAAKNYYASAGTSPAELAKGYMNPYIDTVINGLGNIGQRNIQMNLAPQLTAGAVGSGQFGSQRGAGALAQGIANANADILGAQSSALGKGWTDALAAAGQQNALNAKMGTDSGNLASMNTQNLTNLGLAGGTLAGTNQKLALDRLNALSTIGAAKQTNLQNKEMFPLTNLTTLANLFSKANVPTTVTKTAEGSGLSALGTLGAGTAGLFQVNPTTGLSLFNSMTGTAKGTGLTDWLKSMGVDTSGLAPGAGSGGGGAHLNGGDTTSGSAVWNTQSPTGYVDSSGIPVYEDGTPYSSHEG